MGVRLVALVGLPAFTVPVIAFADAPLEATGFTGVTYLGDDTGLGDSTAAELTARPSLAFGARLSYLPWQRDHSIVGFEVEASHVLGSVTGRVSELAPRHSSPALMFNYRALFVIGLQGPWFRVHFGTGVGASTLTTSSDLLRPDTDAGYVFGSGLAFAVTKHAQLKLDGRQTWMEARDGSWSRSYEVQLGVGVAFGAPAKKRPDLEVQPIVTPVVVTTPPAPTPVVVAATPPAPQPVPPIPAPVPVAPPPEPTPVRVVSAQPAADVATPALPEAVVAAFAAAARVTFDPNKARLSQSAKSDLESISLTLISNPTLRVLITVHPDTAGNAGKGLARKRANAVKWYLMERGAANGQLAIKLGNVSAESPVIELSLAP